MLHFFFFFHSYGSGSRIKLAYTRKIIDAIHSGTLLNANYTKTEVFGLEIPTAIEGVPSEILDPINTVSAFGSLNSISCISLQPYWLKQVTYIVRIIMIVAVVGQEGLQRHTASSWWTVQEKLWSFLELQGWQWQQSDGPDSRGRSSFLIGRLILIIRRRSEMNKG